MGCEAGLNAGLEDTFKFVAALTALMITIMPGDHNVNIVFKQR